MPVLKAQELIGLSSNGPGRTMRLPVILNMADAWIWPFKVDGSGSSDVPEAR